MPKLIRIANGPDPDQPNIEDLMRRQQMLATRLKLEQARQIALFRVQFEGFVACKESRAALAPIELDGLLREALRIGLDIDGFVTCNEMIAREERHDHSRPAAKSVAGSWHVTWSEFGHVRQRAEVIDPNGRRVIWDEAPTKQRAIKRLVEFAHVTLRGHELGATLGALAQAMRDLQVERSAR